MTRGMVQMNEIKLQRNLICLYRKMRGKVEILKIPYKFAK